MLTNKEIKIVEIKTNEILLQIREALPLENLISLNFPTCYFVFRQTQHDSQTKSKIIV